MSTTLPQNKCDSLSVAGPFPQTLFLGCSIIDFTTSLGWNGASSELTVRLVYDSCAGNLKTYWDDNLNQQTTTMADPGFIGLTYDIIGCPVYFRIGQFEYSGLVQHWSEENSASGHPTYSVQLMDPRQLLENSKMIIGDYAGTVGGVANVFNVYGMMESLGVACPQMSLNTPGAGYVWGDSGIDGATFGSPAGAFGGANTNNNGMPWYNIVTGLNLLANSVPKAISQWSPYGRITYKGINFGGFGLIQSDSSYLDGTIYTGFTKKYMTEYFLDLSELPTPPTYWRLDGFNTSIMDTIDKLCKDAGYDYYIELVPINNAYSLSDSGIAKFIKVRTVRRLAQPDLGSISSFIGDGSGSISSKRGVELRNETTSSICIGGPKNTLYQGEITDGIGNHHINGNNDDFILPYFGIYPYDMNTIIPQRELVEIAGSDGKINGDSNRYEWYFWAETTLFNDRFSVLGEGVRDLNNAAHPLVGAGRLAIKLTEGEMLAALAGFDVWLSYIMIKTNVLETIFLTDTGTFVGKNFGVWGLQAGLNKLAGTLKNANPNIANAKNEKKPVVSGSDLTAAFVDAARNIIASTEQEELHILHNWVANFAGMLGKSFQVRVPYTCAKQDDDSALVITSEEPTSSGWTEQSSVIGLAKNSLYAQFMKTEDNRYNAMIVLDDNWTCIVNNPDPTIKKDVTKLSEQEFVLTNDRIYIKSQVESEYVYEDYINRLRPRAVLTISNPVMVQTSSSNWGLNGCLEMLARILTLPINVGGFTDDERKNILTNVGETIAGGLTGRFYTAMFPYNFDTNPIGACCGIKSNVMVYGPWFNVGPVGGVKLENDGGLVPWEYNGYELLNTAGQSKADEGLTRMQVGEMGDISVPGYPTVPLGAELGAMAGGIFGGGSQLIENRSHTLNTYNGSNNFSAQYGYFNYTGAWTGLYGPNITSISVSIGTGGVQTSYSMKTYSPKFGRFSKANMDRIKLLGQNQIKAQKKFMDRVGKTIIGNVTASSMAFRMNFEHLGIPHSPHAWLMGVARSGSGCEVCSISESDKLNESFGWNYKGVMSLDGLLRPVSLAGDGSLPKLSIPLSTAQPTTKHAQPPIYKDASLSYMEYDLPLWGAHIQPWQNPTALGGLAMTRAIGSETGNAHDIAILGHGTIPPSSVVGGYFADYRGMALKGPLFLQSWGYDTEGRPVPNKKDINASGAIFNADTQESFPADFLKHPETWPVAPIDLRFDRDRGVWTTPPSYTLLVGRMITDICGSGVGTAIITDGPTMYDQSGVQFDPSESISSAPRVIVNNRLGCNSYPSGTKVILYYNTKINNGEYHILEGDAPFNLSGLTGTCTGGYNWTNFTTCGTKFGLQFGSGFTISSGTGCTSLPTVSYNGQLSIINTNTCPTGIGFAFIPTDTELKVSNLSFSHGLNVSSGGNLNCLSGLVSLELAISGATGTGCEAGTLTTLYSSKGLSFDTSNFRIGGGETEDCNDLITVSFLPNIPMPPDDEFAYGLYRPSGSGCNLSWIQISGCATG